MTQDQIMQLVDAYAMAQYNQAFCDRYDKEKRSAARAAVVAALETLTKDAERYQWLVGGRTREQVGNPDVGLQPPLPQDLVLSELSSWFVHKEWVDIRIDAAIAAQKGQI